MGEGRVEYFSTSALNFGWTRSPPSRSCSIPAPAAGAGLAAFPTVVWLRDGSRPVVGWYSAEPSPLKLPDGPGQRPARPPPTQRAVSRCANRRCAFGARAVGRGTHSRSLRHEGPHSAFLTRFKLKHPRPPLSHSGRGQAEREDVLSELVTWPLGHSMHPVGSCYSLGHARGGLRG